MAKNLLNKSFSEPLSGATTAKVDINVGDGNMIIDRLTVGDPVLASGTLQYFENQGEPARTLVSSNGQDTFTLRGNASRQPWFHFPWSACNGATEWQIHLNPTIPFDITAHSDGGNVKLDLAGLAVTRVSADTGGGNMEVILTESAENLDLTAKSGAGTVTVEIDGSLTGNNIVNADSGAGNVIVTIPNHVAARIYAASGLGKAIIDPRFTKIDKNTYQSSDFDSATDKVEITVKSGAGNVSVDSR